MYIAYLSIHPTVYHEQYTLAPYSYVHTPGDVIYTRSSRQPRHHDDEVLGVFDWNVPEVWSNASYAVLMTPSYRPSSM